MDGSTLADTHNRGKPDGPLARWKAVMAMRGLTDRQKLVLLAIAFRDGPKGANPSFEIIARDVGLRRWNVTRAVKGLVEAGAVTRKRERYGNRFTINYAYPDGTVGVPSKPDPEIRPDGTLTVFETARAPCHEQEEREESKAAGGAPQGDALPPPADRESAREGATPDGLDAGAYPPAAAPCDPGKTDAANAEWEELHARQSSKRAYIERQLAAAYDGLESALRVLTGREASDDPYDETAAKAEEYHRETQWFERDLADMARHAGLESRMDALAELDHNDWNDHD